MVSYVEGMAYLVSYGVSQHLCGSSQKLIICLLFCKLVVNIDPKLNLFIFWGCGKLGYNNFCYNFISLRNNSIRIATVEANKRYVALCLEQN